MNHRKLLANVCELGNFFCKVPCDIGNSNVMYVTSISFKVVHLILLEFLQFFHKVHISYLKHVTHNYFTSNHKACIIMCYNHYS